MKHPSGLLLLICGLAGFLLFPGCIVGNELVWPQLGPKMCKRDYVEKEQAKTDLGAVTLLQDEGTCSDAGTWMIRAFADGDRRGLLEVKDIEKKPRAIEARAEEPYGLRISARIGRETVAWDFVAAPGLDGRYRGVLCDGNLLDTPDWNLQTCTDGTMGREWSELARALDRPRIFDDAALAALEAARGDVAEMLSVLGYFTATFVHQARNPELPRDAEAEARVRQGIIDVGCGPFLDERDAIWRSYLERIEPVFGDELPAVVGPCDDLLLARWPEDAPKLERRLSDPALRERLDAVVLERADLAGAEAFELWTSRLSLEPEPTRELVDVMDERLLAAIERGAGQEEVPSFLLERIEAAEQVSLSEENARRLQDVLLLRADETPDETIAWLRQMPDDDARRAFVDALDDRFVELFPRSSRAILTRLDQTWLERFDDATRDRILAAARAWHEAPDHALERDACNVVRRLMMLATSRKCTVPETIQ